MLSVPANRVCSSYCLSLAIVGAIAIASVVAAVSSKWCGSTHKCIDVCSGFGLMLLLPLRLALFLPLLSWFQRPVLTTLAIAGGIVAVVATMPATTAAATLTYSYYCFSVVVSN